MPGATHGLLGLVEHALAHQEEAALTGPIAVHCRLDSLVVDITVVGCWPIWSTTQGGHIHRVL